MEKYRCPGCGAPLMPVWRKLSLGIWRSVLCRSCGARVGASWRGLLVFAVLSPILPVGGMLAGGWAMLALGVDNMGAMGIVMFGGAMLGYVADLWAYAKFAPLVVKKTSAKG